MSKAIKQISVIGDGGWGTTLAVHLAKKKYNVTLWGAFPRYVEQVKKSRVNKKFLPGIKIPRSVKLSSDLSAAIDSADLIVLAVPSEFLLSVIKQFKGLNYKQKAFLSVTKGIDIKTGKRMSQLIESELGRIKLAVLSGPTIAKEVAQKIPTTAVIAAKDLAYTKKLQKVFNSDSFRIYTNNDVAGVEVGGSIKNIIAVACGVCDGLGFGSNTKAAIVTRGLAEMSRLGQSMGAKTATFYGLTGLGDLVTTCFSPQSRNRSVGELLGKGKSIRSVLQNMSMVAEGVVTAKAVHKLAKSSKINMPITAEVYNILYRNKKPQKAVSDLMKRDLKSE